MRFQIAHNLPQRLLVRCGKYVFTRKEGYAIEEYLKKYNGIERIRTNYMNGSITIDYNGGIKGQELIKILKKLDINQLEEKEPSQSQLIEGTNQDFVQTLSKMTFFRTAMRILLPKPLQLMYLLNKYRPILQKGLHSLFQRKLNLEVLDATAIGLAFARRDFGTAGSVMFLLGITDQLEEYTRVRAKTELSESLSLHIEDIWVERDGEEKEIPLEQVQMEDIVIVRVGSLIPVDGTVIRGEAMVNEASMTGEPLPVRKDEGKTVFAGTVVEEGEIRLSIRAVASDTKLSHIIEQIDHGDALKAQVQKRNENLADRIVPFNLGLALGTYFVTRNVTKAISLLMVDYSCAIKLSTPITVISSIKEASERGIIVKGGKFMERFAEADTIVFDKTGTLTKAKPEVKEIVAFEGYSEREVLKISACLEEHFPHSVARAIVQKALDEDVRHREEHSEPEYILAHGIASKLHGKRAFIGSYHFVIEDEKVPLTEEAKKIIDEHGKGRSVIYLALGRKLIGCLFIEDPLREEAQGIIEKLRKEGISNITMMTGDTEGAAKRVAEELQLDYYRAGVLPEDKSAFVEEKQNQGHSVVMIGDGINDSPALAISDVSVSLKDSSDIAREVADITLLEDDLEQLVEIRVLSRRMMERIDHNLKTIVGFNSGLMLMGLFGALSPTSIALLHNFSTLVISANSMKPFLEENENEGIVSA
ncbi:MAG: heavy metal translocating P-type ATPase [Tissierellia bacterium]|nr:heavy metal translocating P-type ATPase [Tissierellia bacterium]